MRRLALVSFLAGSLALPAVASAGDPAAAPVPNLQVSQFSLPNGLRVVVNEDHSLPVVAIGETFDVGSRDEHKGQFGFAHLFEHLMFEGSANAPKGVYDQLVTNWGGDDNAETDADFTTYYCEVPSNAFEGALWLEADRIRALDITQDALDNQIKVVEEEYRTDLNEPYTKAEMDLNAAAYAGSPYGHDTLGTFEDLDASTLAEVTAFHTGFYGPQNVVLVVSGDVTTAQVKKSVTDDFGTILTRSTPPRPDYTVPPHPASHLDEKDPLASMPDWMAEYPIPASHTPDHYALELMAEILSGGDSSRLARRLIDQDKISDSVDAGPENARGQDQFDIDVSLLDGHTPTEARAAVEDELATLIKKGVDEKELDAARNRLDSNLINKLEDRVVRAIALGHAAVAQGDPMKMFDPPSEWAKVTTADIQRVAAQYLTPDHRVDMFVTPGK
jgi:predicted Zn-dependent peptidase